MPVVHFRVRWPDGGVETCYSPSTVIKDYFQVGRAYPLAEFVALCRDGLRAASDRVARRYGGVGCGRAMAQLAAIEATAKHQQSDPNLVRIEGFDT